MLFRMLMCVFLCYASVSVASSSFLVITDIHYSDQLSTEEGQDTGPVLWSNALRQLEHLNEQVDFILNLGDVPAHAIWSDSLKGSYELTVFHDLFQADKSQKPMFYIAGNNDSLGGNYQPFFSNGLTPLDFAYEWDGACVFCRELLIDARHMMHDGYYSSYVMPHNKKVMLIALNTAPFALRPFFTLSYPNQQEDALRELSWLEQQLKAHHATQLLIAMHIPPGLDYKGRHLWHQDVLDRFVSLLNQYASQYDEITLISGHTHMDELRQLKLANGRVVYDIASPAISRVYGNNSGMKIISLNDQESVSNYTTYYTRKITQWDDEQYQALGSPSAVFPQCQNTSIAHCLNGLTNDEVCFALEQGLFYSVKSNRVPEGTCHITYDVI